MIGASQFDGMVRSAYTVAKSTKHASGNTVGKLAISANRDGITSAPLLGRVNPGDTVTGWGIKPRSLEALKSAEQRGVNSLNSASAIEHSHRKANLAAVLEKAGIPHAADGTSIRTHGELADAVSALGGEARITGGFSHARVGEAANASGLSDPVIIRNSADLEKFAAEHVDRSRTFFVQRLSDGPEMHAVTAGNSVIRESGSGAGLSAHEQDIAARAARAFGLNAGGVDLARGADGVTRVIDVHATPRGLDAAGLKSLAKSNEFLDAIASAERATPTLADGIESAKPHIGILNMGRVPGKNISRALAEVERQGGHPVFLPAGATQITDAGQTLVHGTPTKLDSVLTRTGSIISDDALDILRRLEQADVPIINGSKPMSLVRDKNIQASTLLNAGVAHPSTTTVSGAADADRALKLLGESMVLKNPASSEGRGVMFLEGEDTVRGVINLFEKRADNSRLVATRAGDVNGAKIELVDRASTERAIKELGDAIPMNDAGNGVRELGMRSPVVVTDTVTGAKAQLDQPVSMLTVSDAFRDAKPGATLKAETWYREAKGVDTRVHVGRINGEHKILAAMERRAAPNEWGEARSNLSIGGGASAVTPDAAQEKAAIEAAKAFDLDVAGVDLIATKNGPVVLEVNASPGLDIEGTTGAVADRWINEAMRLAQR